MDSLVLKPHPAAIIEGTRRDKPLAKGSGSIAQVDLWFRRQDLLYKSAYAIIPDPSVAGSGLIMSGYWSQRRHFVISQLCQCSVAQF